MAVHARTHTHTHHAMPVGSSFRNDDACIIHKYGSLYCTIVPVGSRSASSERLPFSTIHSRKQSKMPRNHAEPQRQPVREERIYFSTLLILELRMASVSAFRVRKVLNKSLSNKNKRAHFHTHLLISRAISQTQY